MKTNINRRESSALINSLKVGVVPRIGLRHIAVGREQEVNTLLKDLSIVEYGGAAFRFICGSYGSGKSFLLQMIRNNAIERNFIVMDADLSPNRRLIGTKNQGLATYKELLQHLSSKTRPDGGALESILQKWISYVQSSVAQKYNLKPGDNALINAVSKNITNTLSELSEEAYGFAFANVVNAYWRSTKTDDNELKQSALRWLRGEYATKYEARRDIYTDTIIDDYNWYEFLKLFAIFIVKAGYNGLLVFLDEGVNLYKIPHKQTSIS